jgi:hypothetical protein
MRRASILYLELEQIDLVGSASKRCSESSLPVQSSTDRLKPERSPVPAHAPFACPLQTLQVVDGVDHLALVPATACPLKVTLEERLFSAGKSKPGNGHQFAECRRAAALTAALA